MKQHKVRIDELVYEYEDQFEDWREPRYEREPRYDWDEMPTRIKSKKQARRFRERRASY